MANKLAKAFGIGAIVLATSFGLNGCYEGVLDIPVSGSRQIGFASNIIYSGMKDDKTFCLRSTDDVTKYENLYYSTSSKEIYFYGKKLKVLEVNPEHIVVEKE
jgi:hypothetical protein